MRGTEFNPEQVTELNQAGTVHLPSVPPLAGVLRSPVRWAQGRQGLSNNDTESPPRQQD